MKSKNEKKRLARDLLVFYDEFVEFNNYCAFMCDAYSSLAAENESLNPDTANGAILCAQWLKRRAGALREDLGRIQKLSRMKRTSNGADTDIADAGRS